MPLYQFDPRLQAKLDKRGGGLAEALQAILAGYGAPEGGPRKKDTMFGLPEIRWLLSQGGLDPFSASILQAILPNFSAGSPNMDVFQQAKTQAREGKQATPQWMGGGTAGQQTVTPVTPAVTPGSPGQRRERPVYPAVDPVRAFPWRDAATPAPGAFGAAGGMQSVPSPVAPQGIPMSGYGGLPLTPGGATLLPRFSPLSQLGGKPRAPIGRFG